MNIRMTAWVALAAILLVLLSVFGPWKSDSTPTAVGPEVVAYDENPAAAAPVLENVAVAPEKAAISRSEVAMARQDRSVFVIVETGGNPVIDAQVLLCRGEHLLFSALSDSDGKAAFASDEQEITLVVAASGRPIFLKTLQLVAGTIEVVLPRGAMVTGKVIDFDGAEPSRLNLRLSSDNPLLDYSSLPKEAREELSHLTRYNSIRTFTAPGGLFRFAGLQESWSGFLRFDSGIVIQQISGGKLLTSGYEIRLEAPQVDLKIELDQPKVITARLVESDSKDPLGLIPLTVRYQSLQQESAQTVHLSSDRQGYFSLKLDPQQLASFALFLGAYAQENQKILRLTGAEIPAAGDLGNIAVPSLRTVRFVLQDHNAQGIAGGFARTGELRSKVTTPSGEGFLHWLSADLTHIRFLAVGYVPQDHVLNEFTPDPLVVTMDSGNRLELEITAPDGVNPDQFRAELTGDSVLINGPAKDLNELLDYVGEDSRPHYQAPGPQLGTQLLARPGSDALIVFQSLRSGVELNLKILGRTGPSVFYREILKPLGPQEIRRHVIDLRQVGSIFHGRVTDLEGNPLVRASVQLGNQILAWTDSSGEFSCLVNESKEKTLLLGHRSSATLFVHNYLVPTHGAAVEFRLEPARSVIIEVVDESGAAIVEAQVFILRDGFFTGTHALGNGRFEASGLSSKGVRVQATVAAQTYVQDLNPHQATTQLVVPVHGSLVVDFSPPPEPGAGQYSVVLIGLNEEPWIVLTKDVSAASEWRCEFPLILPGEYDAVVNYTPSPQEQQEGLSKRSISDTLRVSIEPGQRSQLELSKSEV